MKKVKCLICDKDYELEQGCYLFCNECIEFFFKLGAYLESDLVQDIYKECIYFNVPELDVLCSCCKLFDMKAEE